MASEIWQAEMVIVCAILGLLIGSFINVVVYRLPAGRSIVSPRSACPHCGQALRRRDNVPVLSWLVLRGRCRDCSARIGVRYPLVELGCALLFGAVGARFNPTSAAQFITLAAFLYLAAISLTLALIDSDHHRLPNVIVLPAYLVGVVLLGAASIVRGSYAPFVTGLICAVALFGLYLVLALISRRGMGFGDVKLAGVLGLFTGFLGVETAVVAALGAFVLGGLYSVVLLATRRAGRSTGVAFGPWMLVGAFVAIFFGPEIAAGYLRLFGLGPVGLSVGLGQL